MKDFDIEILEQLAKRFNPLPTNDSFLDNRYEWQKKDNGVEWPYYRFFYHLSKWLKPDLVVELGGYQGTAAAHFAAGNNAGKVVTIDHHTDPGDKESKRRMFSARNIYRNISYIQGWSNPELASSQLGKHALGNAPDAYPYVVQINQKIDILFIDSWHTYENAMLDWMYYKPLLNSPALVICDDIIDDDESGDPISGMMRFWNELPEPKFLNSNLYNCKSGGAMGFVKIG